MGWNVGMGEDVCFNVVEVLWTCVCGEETSGECDSR